MIVLYMSAGIDAGMLPARTRISPSPKISSFLNSSSIFSSLISGPEPLISVPSIFFSFRLIREIPLSILIKSERIPIASTSLIISSPVNPAANPNAVLSIPSFIKIVDTLIPFPPGRINSESVRFVSPS